MSTQDRFKFRVWDNQEGRYVERDHINIKDGHWYCLQYDGLIGNGIDDQVGEPITPGDRFIIENSPGMPDKKGVLIYEGDVFKYLDVLYVVVFDRCHFYGKGILKPNLYFHIPINIHLVEISNTIHDNPELQETT